MEIWDLYDVDRKMTERKMIRGEKTPAGYYRLVVGICIFNSAGEMLIQKRQPFKQGWSGMWDISVGGAAVSGDDSRRAAEREQAEDERQAQKLFHDITSCTCGGCRGKTDVRMVSSNLQ